MTEGVIPHSGPKTVPFRARNHVPRQITQAPVTEGISGLRTATIGRLVSLATIAVMLLFIAPRPEVFYFEVMLVLFAAIGAANFFASKRKIGLPGRIICSPRSIPRSWHIYSSRPTRWLSRRFPLRWFYGSALSFTFLF